MNTSISAAANPADGTYRDDTGAFRPHLALQPSRLFAGLLAGIAVAAGVGAAISWLAWPLKAALLSAGWLMLLQTWRNECRAGLRQITADANDLQQIQLHFADGKNLQATYAGYAVLGTLAIFIFVERSGWKKLLGTKRFTVLRDATSANEFRRLRAWTRLS